MRISAYCLAVLAIACNVATDQRPLPRSGISGSSYIVVLHGNRDPVAEAARIAAKTGAHIRFVYTSALKGFAAEFPAGVSDAATDSAVRYVEPDGVVSVADTEVAPAWGLDRIDQRQLPLDGFYVFPVVPVANIYIIDTGIRTTHVDFGGRAFGAVDEVGDGNGTNDCNGHGTHVAGIAGGTKYGVDKTANLWAVRVLDCNGFGTISGVIAGVDWVTANHLNPAVANMSLAASVVDSALNEAVQASIDSGVVYAVAAGNSSADACRFSPASAPAALTVAAENIFDAIASFSDWGTCVDLFAPGVNITSDFFTSDSAIGTLSGTSMASPHVAGTAALLRALRPDLNAFQIDSALLANATPGVIQGIGPGTPGANTPNLLDFISTSVGSPPPPPPDTPPVASFTVHCHQGTCTFDASSSTDDHGVVAYWWDFGDGTELSTTQPIAQHGYPARGKYLATLIVADAANQTNTTTKFVIIHGNARWWW